MNVDENFKNNVKIMGGKQKTFVTYKIKSYLSCYLSYTNEYDTKFKLGYRPFIWYVTYADFPSCI